MVASRKRAPSVSAEIMLRKAAEARVETLQARLAAALDIIYERVRFVDRLGGYTDHDEQAGQRLARAFLVENGRSGR